MNSYPSLPFGTIVIRSGFDYFWCTLKFFVKQSNYLKMKRASTTKISETKIEDALLKWFEYQRANNLPINGPILQQKANYFARCFGEDFMCSSSWIQRFRVRHGIIGGKIRSDVRRTKIKTNEYPNLPSSSVYLSPQNKLKAYSSNKLKEITPNPEIKLEPEMEMEIREKENDKCCCCLREDGERWLWSSEQNSGDNNVYGKLLEECFNITIGTQMLSDHTICNKCKEQLKQALQFKRQVLECQQRLTESQLPDYDKVDENPLAALQRNKAGIAPGLYANYNQDKNVEYVETELQIEIKEEPLTEENPDPLNVKLEFFLEPKEEIESVVSTTYESRINENTAIPDCNKLNANTVKISAVKQMDEEMLPQPDIMQDISRRGQHMLQSFNIEMPAGKSNPQLISVRKPKRPRSETISKTSKIPKSNKRAGLSADRCSKDLLQ